MSSTTISEIVHCIVYFLSADGFTLIALVVKISRNIYTLSIQDGFSSKLNIHIEDDPMIV